MSTITKESIADTIEGLEHLANSGIQSVYIDMAIAGMRRLLASLEAEHVGYVDDEYAELLKQGHIESCSVYAEPGEGCITVFTAPPATVVPNGWVLAPVEPTYQMCEAMGLPWESPRFPDRYKAMIAAAPQQEV